MRAISILGSPRRHGNTAKALGWVEGQFHADGHQIDHVHILDYHVGGCSECLLCKKADAPGNGLCFVDDDANSLFLRMVEADLVLIAAPIFCWGFPAQIKGLIDRFYCLMDFDQPRTDLPRLRGKPMSLLLTGGGEQIDNANLVFRGFAHLMGLLRARPAGNWYVPNCTVPDALGDEVRKGAIDFAQTLIRNVAS